MDMQGEFLVAMFKKNTIMYGIRIASFRVMRKKKKKSNREKRVKAKITDDQIGHYDMDGVSLAKESSIEVVVGSGLLHTEKIRNSKAR